MSKKTVYICDRCGKSYSKSTVPRSITMGKFGIFNWKPIPGNKIYDRLDMCDDCYRELETWWNGPSDEARRKFEKNFK